MLRLASIYFFFFCLSFSYAALEWIPSSSEEAIPENAIYLRGQTNNIVARARHFDEVLSAELVDGRYAKIKTCSGIEKKYQYEILVSDEACEWKPFLDFSIFPIDVVRGGTASNGEPLFIGSNGHSITSIQYSNKKFDLYEPIAYTHSYYGQTYLSCERNITWVDTSAKNIPENAISGGKLKNHKEIYVGRIKNGCEIYPGQILPHLGMATAVLQSGFQIRSSYAQALVGNPDQFVWKECGHSEIPDFAVVGGQALDGEIMYISRSNGKLGYVLQSKVVNDTNAVFEILINN